MAKKTRSVSRIGTHPLFSFISTKSSEDGCISRKSEESIASRLLTKKLGYFKTSGHSWGMEDKDSVDNESVDTVGGELPRLKSKGGYDLLVVWFR